MCCWISGSVIPRGQNQGADADSIADSGLAKPMIAIIRIDT
jgi:hypothetical protein